ncbi:MAG: hypothetical protein NTX35_01000 [Verrucomicrobia bacterium]|nr:hypothetical protein [Verrucomicrobiota bacterium]
MKHILVALSASLLTGLLHSDDEILTDKWPEGVAILKTSEAYTTKAGDFTISITTPESAEIRAMGGSGGPMMKFSVQRAADGKKIEFYEQVVCAVLLPTWRGFPQIEIWGRGGGGYWSRGLFRFTGGEYKAARYDQFEEWPRHGNEKAETVEPPFRPHGEGDDAGMKLYLIESKKPTP